MEHDQSAVPTRAQRWTALGGLLALVLVVPVVLVVFGAPALPWVLAIGGFLVLVLVVGVVVRRTMARQFPVTPFDLDDVSGPASQIADAKSRLAGGDYAAFTVNAVVERGEAEANGQIWVFADRAGGIEKTSVELSYEWPTEPAEHPAFRRLLVEGWQVNRWEPDGWVLLTRPGDIEASEAVQLVVGALEMLFDLPPSTQWTFQAFA